MAPSGAETVGAPVQGRGMGSRVSDTAAAVALGQLDAGLDALGAAGVEPVDARERLCGQDAAIARTAARAESYRVFDTVRTRALTLGRDASSDCVLVATRTICRRP